MDNQHPAPESATPDEALQATRRQVLEQVNARLINLYGHSCMLSAQSSTSEIVSTGLPTLDEALGLGGLPRGCLATLLAQETEAAAAICLSTLAAGQRHGDTTAYIGNSKRHKALAKALGLNIKRLTLLDPSSAEGAIDICIGLLAQGYDHVALNLLDLSAMATPSFPTSLGQRLRRLAKLTDECHNTLLLAQEPPLAAQGNVADGAFRRARITSNALEFYSAIELRLQTLTPQTSTAATTDMLMAAEAIERRPTATHRLTVTKNALGPAGQVVALSFEPGQGFECCALTNLEEAPF